MDKGKVGLEKMFKISKILIQKYVSNDSEQLCSDSEQLCSISKQSLTEVVAKVN